nr:FliH/SctL family protein [uncultured Desulfobulbus sp.]
MSSSKEFKSKVFKADSLFTPHSLVRQTLDPLSLPQKPEPVSTPESIESEAVEKTPETIDPVDTSAAKPNSPPNPKMDAEPKPEPTTPQPPPEPPQPEPPPEPAIDLEALRQEGYAQGYEQAMAESAAQIQAKVEQSLQSFATACQKIDQINQERLKGTHADLVNLVIALTEKILNQELTTPRNQIATTLENALEQAITSEEFHVSLHPEDLAFAEERAPALISSIRGLEHLVFKADPGIRRGGCYLESVSCSVDATIDGKLESTRELLTGHPELVLNTEDNNEEVAATAEDTSADTIRKPPGGE